MLATAAHWVAVSPDRDHEPVPTVKLRRGEVPVEASVDAEVRLCHGGFVRLGKLAEALWIKTAALNPMEAPAA